LATRRVIRSIVHDVTESLMSRNDDVAGYWALGQLVSHALTTRTSSYEIDLALGTSVPSLAESPLSAMQSSWSELFWRNVEHQRLPRTLVRRASATINLEFTGGREGTRGAAVEHLLQCRVDVQDDHGRTYSRTVQVWCSPHDPRRELKSGRGA